MRTAFPTTEIAPAACPCHDATTTTLRLARTSRRGRGRPGQRARSSGALGASMQREGAVPDSFVKKKCHAHRIFRPKHREAPRIARTGGTEKCHWTLRPDCEQAIFSTTNLQPTSRRSTASLFFPPVFVFDHFTGLALPAPHSGWSTPMPHRSLFYLQLPPPCSPPPHPLPSHCLTTSRCLRPPTLPDLR